MPDEFIESLIRQAQRPPKGTVFGAPLSESPLYRMGNVQKNYRKIGGGMQVVSPEDEAAPYAEPVDDLSNYGGYTSGHGRHLNAAAPVGTPDAMKARLQLVRVNRQIEQLVAQRNALMQQLKRKTA